VWKTASCTCAACGDALVAIGEDSSEQLDCEPARFFVRKHIYPTYACRACETITVASVPPAIIERGRPAPGLLAHVLVSKYADHLPLYRQSQIATRSGVELPRSTLADWVSAAGAALAPLVAAMRQELLCEPVVHARSGRRSNPASLSVRLSQCDAREAHHDLRFLPQSQRRACAPLSRRLERHADVEAEARGLDPPARHQHRQRHSVPILHAYKTWIDDVRRKVAGNTGLAKALDYTIKRWPALARCFDDGRHPVDNNAVENAIRPVALGRKNWMFTGSQRAGERAAVIMSLIATAKANGHDPYAYLKDVLTRLPTQLDKHIAELLPNQWSPA
jgi:transposase